MIGQRRICQWFGVWSLETGNRKQEKKDERLITNLNDELQDAFIRGMEASSGWLDYFIFEEDFEHLEI